MIRKKFSVSGMTCSSCSAHVEHDVSLVEGVNHVEVSLMTNSMIVEYDEERVDEDKIIKAVENGGYSASIYVKDRKLNNDNKKEEKNKLKKLIASIILMLILMYFSMGPMIGLPLPLIFENHQYAYLNGLIQFIFLIPIIILNKHYFINGLKRLFKFSPNMDSLIALGSGASLVYGIFALIMIIIGIQTQNMALIERYHMELYFESAGMILTLVSLGKYFENRSKRKTTQAITKLLDLTPKMALLLKDNIEVEINVDDIKVGDVLIVKPGTSIPIDGKVIEGMSSVDESTLTGESMPVLKKIGSLVKSGTTNINGILKIEATCESTTLQKIIDLVDVASNSKAPIARLADKISLYFVPAVIGIAIVTFIVWILISHDFEFSLARAISILVISCPCALGLATPVAIMVGTYKAVNYGILIKSGESLETLHKVNTIILDKTGTITYGKPHVTDITTYHIDEEELLKIAYSLEKNSEHPLSYSINQLAISKEITSYEVKHFENILGKGIKGVIHDQEYFIGNTSLINQEYDLKRYQELSNRGKTVIFVFTNREVLGMIALKDEVKPSTIDAIEMFKKLEVETIMLTGDNEDTAKVIAEECGITKVIAKVLPEQKAKVVEEVKASGKIVAMVGDGINDSVALTMANVGIAMGSGTDVAIESAEVVLMKDDLSEVATAIQLSKKVIANIKINLFWAFFYNILFIPIAAGVLYAPFHITLSPMICALAMSLSSICVVLNALRINNFKKEKK